MIKNTYRIINILYNQPLDNLFSISSKNNELVAFDTRDNLNKIYQKNAVQNVDLSKFKKVYFDPACTFPRFKLSQYTDIKRCLKIEKADAIIISLPKFNNEFYSEFIVFHSPSSDEVYALRKYDLTSLRCENAFGKENVTADDVLKQLISKQLVESDCIHIFTGIPLKLSTDVYKSLLNMQNTTQPFIIDSDLDKAISNTQDVPDSSDLNSVKEFLSSTDTGTVELGMKLLLNYNVLQKACTIGLLILRYSRPICNTNAVNSVGFKNLLTSLNLTKNDLFYFGESDIPRYLKKLYEITTDQDDKDNARQMVIEILMDSMKQQFDSYGDIVKVLDIKSEIKLY